MSLEPQRSQSAKAGDPPCSADGAFIQCPPTLSLFPATFPACTPAAPEGCQLFCPATTPRIMDTVLLEEEEEEDGVLGVGWGPCRTVQQYSAGSCTAKMGVAASLWALQ